MCYNKSVEIELCSFQMLKNSGLLVLSVEDGIFADFQEDFLPAWDVPHKLELFGEIFEQKNIDFEGLVSAKSALKKGRNLHCIFRGKNHKFCRSKRRKV